jgi:hypothetical protein
MKSINTTILLLITVLFFFSHSAIGEESDVQIVSELMELSGAKKQYDQIIAVMINSMQEGFKRGFNEELKAKSLDDETRSKASDIYTKYFNLIAEDLKQFMEKEIPWERMVSDVYAPVYLKHFNIEEIKSLNEFYQTDLGKKLSIVSPQLIKDSSDIFNQVYGAQLNSYTLSSVKKRLTEAQESLKDL